MSRRISTLFIVLALQFSIYRAIAAIGDWKAYMAYYDVQEIEEAGNLVFVQASNDLYVYNKNDQSIQTFSKVDYLNDCDIQHIAYNKSANRLVILYNNSNIDLMNIKNYEVTNLPDYANGSISGDKTVNNIYMYGAYAYLSTNFGIVKLNVKDTEISDTYNLGFKVDWCEIKGQDIYAYSSTYGKYHALLTDNLLDPKTWDKIGGYVAKTVEDKSELKQLVSTLNPGGPKYNNFACMKFAYGQLYTCGGGYYSGLSKPGCIQVLQEDESWNNYPKEDISTKTGVSFKDLLCLDVSPTEKDHLFAGGRNGLYEFKDGEFVNYYNTDNSPIQSFNNTSKEYELILGTSFDKDGNLWVLNSQAPTQSIIEYTKDKQWISHPQSILMKLDDAPFKNKSLGYLRNIIFDNRGLMWFVNAHWTIPSFYCYQTSNNAIKGYTSFINEDGTTISATYVNCLAEDNNHDIWIGTNAGPVLLTQEQMNNDNSILTQVKVPRNDGTNLADYLLSDVNISCIAVDKGNRKWFGTTNNGVYLISSDNIQQLQHFTSSNSPLLSDNVESIAINDDNGLVYFGTDKGLCAYQSAINSINEEMTKDNVWAYPNPVRPDYTGPITITGLSLNAQVTITTSNGTLVNKGTSSSGIYTWNGCDLKGKRVASGIYMVMTATENGEKGCVCKIAIVR